MQVVLQHEGPTRCYENVNLPPPNSFCSHVCSMGPAVSAKTLGLIEEIQVGCRELQARRYITDGFCTSFKAINEVVCTGHCLPEKELPWYAEFVKTIARSKLKEWRCVEDRVQKRPISLLCQDGTTRQYTIKVVKSCKCKKQKKKHNKTDPGGNQETKYTRRRGKIPKDLSAKGS
ncbi:Sclerostin domain-containing protein 1 [Bulinus truncatus]|nr:Sclerostin domain-containing protein 1 [Bulinus truncatus]